jgi:hypothetical protein
MKTENPANTAFPSTVHCDFPSFKEFTDLRPNNYPIPPTSTSKPIGFSTKHSPKQDWIVYNLRKEDCLGKNKAGLSLNPTANTV